MALARRSDAADLRQQMERKIERTSGAKFDPREIRHAQGHSIRGKLVRTAGTARFEGDRNIRVEPWIQQTTHSGKGKDGFLKVICPQNTKYVSRNCYCNICKECWELFQDGRDNGVKSSEELNRKVKGKFHGYVPFYVIDDTFNPENNGHVKILHFVTQTNDEFMRVIEGIDKKGNPIPGAYPLGENAWYWGDDGASHELCITVSKGQYGNDYGVSFAPTATSCADINAELVAKEYAELNFDKDYYLESTEDELDQFLKECIYPHTIGNDAVAESVGNDIDTLTAGATPATPARQPMSVPAATPAPVETVATQEAELDEMFGGGNPVVETTATPVAETPVEDVTAMFEAEATTPDAEIDIDAELADISVVENDAEEDDLDALFAD